MQPTEDEQDHGHGHSHSHGHGHSHGHSHSGVGNLEEDVKTIPYWLDTAPPFEDGATDPLPDKVDVAIIGGGLTGLSAALSLARKGMQVVVFEKDTVGFSASGRNGGMCTPGLATDTAGVVKKHGLARAKEMYHSFNAAIDYVEKLIVENKIDCNFERTGKFTVASKPHHYEHLVKRHNFLAENFGYETSLIPRSDIRYEIGSDIYYGGLLDKQGAGFHVGKFVRGLARVATKLGVHIYEGTAVTNLRRLGGYEHEIATAKGTIRAAKVLLATGSLTGPQFGWFQRRIVPVGSFIIVTEPLTQTVADEILPTRRMTSDTLNIGHYFRLTPDNRLLFGGRARFAISNAASDRKSGGILKRDMLAVYPQLSGTRIDYCWGGLVDMTADRLPRAGEKNGLFYSMGYSGHGTQMATYMGAQMVELMDGKAEANTWRQNPWPSIPGHFGPPWFLPLVGVYYRLKDFVG
jgi:glycine/D-amino acid oxidase-like deaminating enzyme